MSFTVNPASSLQHNDLVVRVINNPHPHPHCLHYVVSETTRLPFQKFRPLRQQQSLKPTVGGRENGVMWGPTSVRTASSSHIQGLLTILPPAGSETHVQPFPPRIRFPHITVHFSRIPSLVVATWSLLWAYMIACSCVSQLTSQKEEPLLKIAFIYDCEGRKEWNGIALRGDYSNRE